jgi:hypothetical protein
VKSQQNKINWSMTIFCIYRCIYDFHLYQTESILSWNADMILWYHLLDVKYMRQILIQITNFPSLQMGWERYHIPTRIHEEVLRCTVKNLQGVWDTCGGWWPIPNWSHKKSCTFRFTPSVLYTPFVTLVYIELLFNATIKFFGLCCLCGSIHRVVLSH